MQTRHFKGYQESADLSKISKDNLAYPSRNVIIEKGVVKTREGLVNDGVAHTEDSPIHSEFLWKDAIGGDRWVRAFAQTVQVKVGDNWHTIFTSLDSDVERVIFASWTDGNGSVIKNRLMFCDGSTTLYSWNGFVGTVESVAGAVHTMVADKTNLGLMGADAGDVTAQTVIVYDMNAGAIDAQEEETYSDDPTLGLDITLDSAPSFTAVAGDIIISKPVAYADEISANDGIDAIFTYQNHLVAASYDRVDIHLSHRETFSLATGMDFTQPGAGSRTAITPVHLYLDANFRAMGERKNVLWVSDTDDWYKVTKTVEENAYGLWTDVEKFPAGELKGALPMAIARHKSDLIYLAQDGTVQRITTLDIIDDDDIELLSDKVEGMFDRFDLDDARLYYMERGIYIVLPDAGQLLIIDTSEETWFFQPPQDIPINCISIVDGVKYGHHNARNETYKLFSGRNDLDAERAPSVIALGYQRDGKDFELKKHGVIGMDCRLTDSCNVLWERYFEQDGANAISSDEFTGSGIVKYTSEVDGGWGTHPYATIPIGGEDEVGDIYRAFVFSRDRIDGYFEHRPILTITGVETEFHLLGLYWASEQAPRFVPEQLFIDKNA